MLAAVAAAREPSQLSLGDALDLTILIGRKDAGRYQRVAARWLLRLLEESPDATIGEAATPPRASSPLPASATRRRLRRSEPWPKERLGAAEHVISWVPVDVVVHASHKQVEAVDTVIDRGADYRDWRISEAVAGNLRPAGPGVVL